MCDGDTAHAAARKILTEIGNLPQPAGVLLPSAKPGGVHNVVKAQAEPARPAHMPLKNVRVNLRQPVRRSSVPREVGPVCAINLREAGAAVGSIEQNQFIQQRVAPGGGNRVLEGRGIFRPGRAFTRMACGDLFFRQIHGLDGILAPTRVNLKVHRSGKDRWLSGDQPGAAGFSGLSPSRQKVKSAQGLARPN